MRELESTVAVITGDATGIGFAAAKARRRRPNDFSLVKGTTRVSGS
jgi:hypothetical protein